jgi:hypothetical protein
MQACGAGRLDASGTPVAFMPGIGVNKPIFGAIWACRAEVERRGFADWNKKGLPEGKA